MNKWKFFLNISGFIFCLTISIFISFFIIQTLEKLAIIKNYELGFWKNMAVGKHWVYGTLPIFIFSYSIFFIVLNKGWKSKNKLTKKGKEIAKRSNEGHSRWQDIAELLEKSYPVFENQLNKLNNTGWILNQFLIKEKYIPSIKKLINQNNKKSTLKIRNKIASALLINQNKKELKDEIDSQSPKDKRLFLIDTHQAHQLLIGSTGSGKTQQAILPQIDVLAKSKSKPSIVISDIKGEIFDKKAKLLNKNGYEIKTINFKHPKKSSHWNPFYIYSSCWNDATIINFYLDNFAENNQLELENLNISSETINMINQELKRDSKKILNNEKNRLLLKDVANQLEERTQEGISELSHSIFTTSNSKDKYWIQMARNIFIGLAWYMFEEYRISLNNHLKTKELKSISLKQINISAIAQMGAIPSNILKDILIKDRETHFRAWRAISSAINTINPGERFSQFAADLEVYSLNTTKTITSNDDIDLFSITNKPTVLFIIIPDSKEAYNPFVTNLIDQVYKRIIWKTNLSKTGKLSRELYFILDEFGNFPKISKMETMVTASRSRGIKLLLGIQSYSQLSSKYGVYESKTLMDNMDFTKYIMTNGQETAEQISKKLGSKMVWDEWSKRITSKPLLNASEVKQIPKWTGIILASRNFPIKTNDYPDYLFHDYENLSYEISNRVSFDEEEWVKEHYWDVEKEKLKKINRKTDISLKSQKKTHKNDLEVELEKLSADSPWKDEYSNEYESNGED